MLRALYVDLDGTLLGPRGSLFRASDGGFSMDGARVLQACDRAGVEVVIYTGRQERGVDELMRLIGQRSYIFELGCGLVVDGEREWLTGDLVPSNEHGTIFEQIQRFGSTGAAAEDVRRPARVPHAVVHRPRGLPRVARPGVG